MIPKFRAWDKNNKKMFTNEELIVWNDNVYANDRRKLTVDKLKGWSVSDKYLMQFTGICDKHGVRIFEKDIVKFSIDNGSEYVCDGIGFVYYCLGAYRILNGLDETLINTNAYLISDIDKIEVLGNIYENPELMEADDDTK